MLFIGCGMACMSSIHVLSGILIIIMRPPFIPHLSIRSFIKDFNCPSNWGPLIKTGILILTAQFVGGRSFYLHISTDADARQKKSPAIQNASVPPPTTTISIGASRRMSGRGDFASGGSFSKEANGSIPALPDSRSSGIAAQ
jgi:hypothetical protein